MKSVLTQADANVSVRVDPQAERKVDKLRTESSRAVLGCAQPRTSSPMPLEGAGEEMKSVNPINGSPMPGKRKPESRDVAKDVGTTTQEARLQALRTRLRNEPLFQDAAKAYDRLAEEGCDLNCVDGYLRRVSGYKSGNIGRRVFRISSGREVSRKIRSINRQLGKLAHRVDELRGIWGLWARMVDADAVHVPEELRKIAARLSCVRTEGFRDWFPQRQAIIDLLELVRKTTCRAHYAEVSLLINAALVWQATKNGREIPDREFDADSLKMIVRRDKQRQAAIARKRAIVKKRLKFLSVEYSPRQMLGLDPID